MTVPTAFEWFGLISGAVSSVATVGAFATGGAILMREIRRDRIANQARMTAWWYSRGDSSPQGAAEWHREPRKGSELNHGHPPARAVSGQLRRGAVLIHNGGDSVQFDATVDIDLPEPQSGDRVVVIRMEYPGGTVQETTQNRFRLVAHRALQPQQTLTLAELLYLSEHPSAPRMCLYFRDPSGQAWRKSDYQLRRVESF